MSANQGLSAKVLQDMIQETYDKEHNRYETVYNTKQPGKSPSQISFDKTNEIFVTLATPLKAMRAKGMADAAANCFKDKWMDDAFPNPHQVEMCTEKANNKIMGEWLRKMTAVRESQRYKYQDCMVTAGNNIEEAVYCVRGYLTGIDADNVTLKAHMDTNGAKYL